MLINRSSVVHEAGKASEMLRARSRKLGAGLLPSGAWVRLCCSDSAEAD